MKSWWRAAAFLALYCGHEAVAQEAEHLFETPRVYGRGRTFVAAYDSNDATRMNPATLAEPKLNFQLRLLELDAFMSKNTVNIIKDLTSLGGKDDAIDYLRKFDDKFGERQYIRGQLMPFSMRFGSFEISPFAVNASWLDLRNPVVPEVEWKSDTYAGLGVSYAYLLGKTLSFGVTVRPMQRTFFAGEVAFADLLDFLPPSDMNFEDYSKPRTGSGIGVDAGLVWMPSKTFRWGLLVQNVGDTGFGKGEDTPPPLRQEVNTGILYRFPTLAGWNLDFLMDGQGLTNRDGVNLLRLMHVGFELGRQVFSRDNDFGIVAGVNEGYLVGGLFADLWVMRLEVANYSVELEKAPGQRPDHRVSASIDISMTF